MRTHISLTHQHFVRCVGLQRNTAARSLAYRCCPACGASGRLFLRGQDVHNTMTAAYCYTLQTPAAAAVESMPTDVGKQYHKTIIQRCALLYLAASSSLVAMPLRL